MAKQPTGLRKLSEKLGWILIPFVDAAGVGYGHPALALFLEVSMTVWNAGVLERSGIRRGALAELFESLVAAGIPDDQLKHLKAQSAAQLRAVPFDQRFMVECRLVESTDNRFTLRVEGCSVADLEHLTPAQRSRVESLNWGPSGRVATKARGDAPDREAEGTGWQGEATGALGGLLASGTAELASPVAVEPSRSRAGRKHADMGPRVVGEEPWGSLYRRAKELQAEAPWERLSERDVFGVRLPGDQEIHWCSVLGAGGEFRAVVLYRGDAGYQVLQELAAGTGEQAVLCGFDGFLFSFLDRELLTPGELKHIRSSGVKFRGRNAWPQLEQARHGRLPRPFGEDLAPYATQLLELVLEALRQLQDPLEFPSGRSEGDLPLFELDGDRLHRSLARPGPAPEPEFPPVDQLAVARLLQKAPRSSRIYEFDLCAVQGRVGDEAGWEFPPLLSLGFDQSTGLALAVEVDAPDQRFRICAKNLLALLNRTGALPRQILVEREWIQSGLAPTATALGIQLSLCSELIGIQGMRAEFLRWQGS